MKKTHSEEKSRLRILIVEDDYSMRRNLEAAFSVDYSTECAGDGKEGLEVLRSSRTDVWAVITDYQMPQMDGLELLGAILQEQHNVCGAILVSGDPELKKQAAEIQKAYSAASVPLVVVEKPFSPDDVFSFIQNLDNPGERKSLQSFGLNGST